MVRIRSCIGIGALILIACACTRPSARGLDSSVSLDAAADSTWYVPPGGCAGNAAIRLPADSLRISSGWSDTTRDRNAQDAALARVVPGGWGGEWLENRRRRGSLARTARTG